MIFRCSAFRQIKVIENGLGLKFAVGMSVKFAGFFGSARIVTNFVLYPKYKDSNEKNGTQLSRHAIVDVRI